MLRGRLGANVGAGRPIPLALPGAVLAVVVLALIALLPARAEAANPPNPLVGNASWVWYVSSSGGSGQAIGRSAERFGLDAVYVKSGDGSNYWSQFSTDLVRGIHAHGVDVCAWQFVYGASPSKEARVAARAVEAGADCLIIDAEADYEGRYASAETYVAKLRRRVGASYPLALSGFPYADYHPSFPYSVFLGPGGAQYNLPQLYWYAIGDPVQRAFEHTFSFNAPYDRPIYPIGQTWQDPPKQQVLDFRRLARAYGSNGVSWWSWQETRKNMWPRLTESVGGKPPGGKPKLQYAELRHGDQSDLVLWAQELVLGRGIDVPVSGNYGSKTVHAVKAVQREAGLKASGAVDQATWLELLEGKPVRIDWSQRGRPSAFGNSTPGQRADEIPPPAERTG